MFGCRKNSCLGETSVIKDLDGLYGAECVLISGGHKTIGVPQFVLQVDNFDDGDCVLFDDNAVLLQDDDNSFVCVDDI
jgi:hypothetical protein